MPLRQDPSIKTYRRKLSKRAMYEGFAHWLTHVYCQRSDKPLVPGTETEYFGCLINLALHFATERAHMVTHVCLPRTVAARAQVIC